MCALTNTPTFSNAKKKPMPKQIRVIVIDAGQKKVYEQIIEPKLQSFYDAIGCQTIEAVYPQGLKKHLLYVDEEGLYKGYDTGFRIIGYPGVICGSAVFLGTDGQGNDRDCKFDAESIQAAVQFVDLLKLKPHFG